MNPRTADVPSQPAAGEAADAPPAQQLDWVRDGEQVFADTLARVRDDLTAPSLLPGWNRAHVAAHVAGNAKGLRNLLHWARTGEVTPMYTSTEERLRDIERWSARPPQQLCKHVTTAAHELSSAIGHLPTAAWSVPVRSALGRDISASDVPWLRVREVWIHAVDLDAGTGFNLAPPALIDTLLSEVCRVISSRDGCPAAHLVPDDRTRTWQIGDADPSAPRLTGTAAELLAWVTGRTSAPSPVPPGAVPALPAWL